MTILLEFPFPIVQGTYLTSFQPPGNTVKVESVITYSPSHGTFLTRGRGLIRLALDTQIHNMISTNCTVVDDDIPGPKSNGIPFLDFESFSFTFGGTGRGLLVVLVIDFHFCAHFQLTRNKLIE